MKIDRIKDEYAMVYVAQYDDHGAMDPFTMGVFSSVEKYHEFLKNRSQEDQDICPTEYITLEGFLVDHCEGY